MASGKEPFFYYIITMSSHEPFRNVLHYNNDERFQNIGHELTRNYITSISYVDAELQEFVTHVTSRFPDTYIFIYGDHTPYVINSGPYQRSVVRLDEKELEFVPLFIITPDRKKYTEKQRVASYLDFAPTILSASGVSASIMTSGTNLLDTPLRETHVNYRGGMYDRDQLFNLVSNNHSRDLSVP
jgi:phosphoglycerol transferase MdoB-like AlkP superfamily enzyme